MEAPTTDTIREALLTKARAIVTAKQTSFSAICINAGVESKFLSRVEKGENFSVKTYQKVIDWIDASERPSEMEKAS